MRINIYLSHYEKKQLSELKFKYHLSFSTMANIIVHHSTVFLLEGNIEKLDQDYRYKDKACKTSIKIPNDGKNYKTDENISKYTGAFWKDYTNLSKLYTNMVRRYLKNDYNDIDEKVKTKMLNKIINDFRNTYDPNWNGNEFQRAIPRIIKQNPEYFRKLLEEC